MTIGGEVVRPCLYPDDAEKSKDYIKNLADYDDEVPNPNIDALRSEIDDTHQFRMKMKLASDSGYERDHDEDQVQDQDLGGMNKETCNHYGRRPRVIANRLTSIEDELVFLRKLLEKKPRRRSKCVSSLVRSSRKRIQKALQFVNTKKTKVNALDGSPLSHPAYVHNDDGPSSPLVDDSSCKTLPLIDLVHVHDDDDDYSSPLPDQVDNASCKTLPGEVADSTIDSDDRSPDERITDVLAQIHGNDDIEKFRDAAKNGY
ncbi:hypothetical protein K7X08_031423 [Anisodus acutangulus]|uniref:Uncharacterized protein n=1 Tax=Anisodus acutangulus TaxID=402998 RepID=A0A9Q1RMQ4_9SOLA|nr:hypothetical protein K7X08_031423 [Anisodus acutangulus]